MKNADLTSNCVAVTMSFVKELGLNPIRLYEKGLLVLDARWITKRKA
jgi:hypothetical protein